ncbi:MAG: AAA family ATPase [Deltaproteobacteria bacterium]|jgi:hypothetical protein|nr:AAA family ATPase [Deltaproteobacteria bacterium]
MPLLTALHLKDYKVFDHEVTLPLAPLTVVIGPNSAGKSAAVRALAILERSLAEENRSVWRADEADGPGRGASFASFPRDGERPRRFEVGLGWADGSADRFTLAQTPPSVFGFLKQVSTSEGVERKHRVDDDWEDEQGAPIAPPRFEGLCPAEGELALAPLRERLRGLRGRVQWLSGSRAAAAFEVQRRQVGPRLAPDGGDVALRLVDAGAGPVRDGVNQFLREAFGHGAIDVHDLSAEKVQLRVGRLRGTPLPLALVGDGVGKSLPVVVAAHLLHQAPAERSGVVLIEDPEAHLHDDAIRALALHLAQLAGRWQPGRSLVLETHSRTLVLAVQLAVRRGLITPDRVALVWAGGRDEPVLERIAIDASGAPQGTRLRGAFAEDARLAAEIAGLDAGRAPAPTGAV